MPYARLDDRYDDHRKIKRAWRREPAAVALHAMAITYANRHATDGKVEVDWIEEKLALLPFREKQRQNVVAVLVELGLFDVADDEHYFIHDFLDWNRSRAQREALAEQGRRGGQAKAAAQARRPDDDGSGPGSGERLAEAKPSLAEGFSTPTPTPTPTPTETLTPENTSSSGDDVADVEHPDDVKNCRLLGDLAKSRNPKFKVKSRARWLTDMRLLRERDGNSPEEIERAIQWVFADDFWGGVVQSPGNLREHFPTIWDRMNHNVVPMRRKPRTSAEMSTPAGLARAERILERLREQERLEREGESA